MQALKATVNASPLRAVSRSTPKRTVTMASFYDLACNDLQGMLFG